MNLFDAARILKIRDWQLAEKLKVHPRTFRRYKSKLGLSATIQKPNKCIYTVDMFSGDTQIQDALKNFDALWSDFVGRALQRKPRK